VDKEKVEEAAEKAYHNLVSIVELNLGIVGGYFNLIIKENFEDEKMCEEIINQVFFRLCDEISLKINEEELTLTSYKSYSYNSPSEDLINDCFKIVNDFLKNKKSRSETTLIHILHSLSKDYSKEEKEKVFDTIFDILLNYYKNINK